MFQDEFEKVIEVIGGKLCFRGLFIGLGVGFVIGIILGWSIFKTTDTTVEPEVVREVSLEIVKPEMEPSIVSEELNLACVDISGAVKFAGVYCLSEGSLLTHYIAQADGVSVMEYSKKYFEQKVNGATTLFDGAKVYIPYDDDVLCEFKEVDDPLYVGGKDLVESEGVLGIKEEVIDDEVEVTVDKEDIVTDMDCLDLNTATLAELDKLVGIGPATAQNIIDARPFQVIDELLDVSGIGETKFDAIDEFVCIL